MGAKWMELSLAIAIGIVSFAIGFNLKFSDFKRVFVEPKAIMAGLVLQMIVLPLIAFILIYFWPIEPVYKVGFLLIAACPGGTMSTFVTFMLKGRVSLSVSMTAFNSFLILFSIPVILNLAFEIFTGNENDVNLNFWSTSSEVIYSVILPVMGGLVLNELTSDQFAEKLKGTLRYIIGIVLMGTLITVLWFDEDDQTTLLLENLNLFAPLVLLNLLTMVTGYRVARQLDLSHDAQYTIAIEMGLQNSALAIFIANNVIHEPKISTVALLYGSFTLFSTWAIAYLLKNQHKGHRPV